MLARFWAKQDPHSLYLAAASVLFGFTLVFDIVFRTEASFTTLNWVLLVIVTCGLIAVLSLGAKFPKSIGLVSAALLVIVSLLFISPVGSEQLAASSAQELPVAALYLGWFIGRALGRWLMVLIVILLAIVMALNPIFHSNGSLGPSTAVQIIIVNLLCFEVGSALWRQSERRLATDTLTGALNRKTFMARLTRELDRSQHDSRSRTLLLIDFDGFKVLNDLRGHAQGDEVLVSAVAAWRSGLRKTDFLGRIGGDEFALLLNGSDELESEIIVARLRALTTHPWSYGLACVQPADSVDSLFVRAAKELYRAKSVRQ